MVSDQEFWAAMDDMSTVSRRLFIILLGIILCYKMDIIFLNIVIILHGGTLYVLLEFCKV